MKGIYNVLGRWHVTNVISAQTPEERLPTLLVIKLLVLKMSGLLKHDASLSVAGGAHTD